jgi:hypothetical protein
VTALAVADLAGPRDVAEVFRAWDAVVVRGEPVAEPVNDAYRRAGSCFAQAIAMLSLLVVGLLAHAP